MVLADETGQPASVSLKTGGFRVIVESEDPGARLDALRLISVDGGADLTFEAERGRPTSGAGLVFLVPEASGGAMTGTLVPAGPSEELVQTFRGAVDGLDAVRLAVSPRNPNGRVRFRLAEPNGGPVHFDQTARIGDLSLVQGLATIRFDPVPDSGQALFELAVTVEPGDALELVSGEAGGIEDGELRHGAELLGSSLRFEARYRTVWKAAGLAALALAGLTILLGLRGRPRLALALLGPALLVPALALFQRDYTWLHAAHFMPDQYDVYAIRLHDFAAGGTRAALENLRSFLAGYAHAHSPGVPAILALMLFAEPDLPRNYSALSGAAALASVGLLFALARRAASSERIAFAVAALGTTHFLFVRAAMRTSTDMPGFLAVVAALYLGLRLLEAPRISRAGSAALLAVVTAGLFVRPSILPVGLAIAAAGILHDGIRSRRIWVWGAVAVVPIALFFGLNFAIGLGHSFALARAKAVWFEEARTWQRLALCLAILFQAFPLLAAVPRAGARRLQRLDGWRPATLLGFIWLVASVAFVVASGAPFWNRYFLPALPGLLLVALPAIETLDNRNRRLLEASVAILCLANLALVALNIWRELPLDLSWAWYVLT